MTRRSSRELRDSVRQTWGSFLRHHGARDSGAPRRVGAHTVALRFFVGRKEDRDNDDVDGEHGTTDPEMISHESKEEDDVVELAVEERYRSFLQTRLPSSSTFTGKPQPWTTTP